MLEDVYCNRPKDDKGTIVKAAVLMHSLQAIGQIPSKAECAFMEKVYRDMIRPSTRSDLYVYACMHRQRSVRF